MQGKHKEFHFNLSVANVKMHYCIFYFRQIKSVSDALIAVCDCCLYEFVSTIDFDPLHVCPCERRDC